MFLQEQVLTLWENECLKRARESLWEEDLFKGGCVCSDTRKNGNPGYKKGTNQLFYFINDGIQSALEKAKQSSKGKDIRIQGGGANIIQQFLNAGLVDEFFIHIAPVVF